MLLWLYLVLQTGISGHLIEVSKIQYIIKLATIVLFLFDPGRKQNVVLGALYQRMKRGASTLRWGRGVRAAPYFACY
jgi:hypothetical protein